MFAIVQADNDQANYKDVANVSHFMSCMITMSIEESHLSGNRNVIASPTC